MRTRTELEAAFWEIQGVMMRRALILEVCASAEPGDLEALGMMRAEALAMPADLERFSRLAECLVVQTLGEDGRMIAGPARREVCMGRVWEVEAREVAA
jgi:hypothetical protein